MLLILALLSASDAEAALHTVEQQFGARSRAESERALVKLVADGPSTPAAGRALIWLGELALTDGRLDVAADRFVAARRSGASVVLAERGLGDVAMRRGHTGDAATHYAAGLAAGPSAPLAIELTEKRMLAERSGHRHGVELAAWATYLAALLWLGRGLLRRRPSLPFETVWLAPICALLVVVAWRRDPAVGTMLLWIAAGALLLTSVAFAAPAPSRTKTMPIDLLAAIFANLALGYIAARRAGTIDALMATLRR